MLCRKTVPHKMAGGTDANREYPRAVDSLGQVLWTSLGRLEGQRQRDQDQDNGARRWYVMAVGRCSVRIRIVTLLRYFWLE